MFTWSPCFACESFSRTFNGKPCATRRLWIACLSSILTASTSDFDVVVWDSVPWTITKCSLSFLISVSLSILSCYNNEKENKIQNVPWMPALIVDLLSFRYNVGDGDITDVFYQIFSIFHSMNVIVTCFKPLQL